MVFSNWSIWVQVDRTVPLSLYSSGLTSFMRLLCLVTTVRTKDRYLNPSLTVKPPYVGLKKTLENKETLLKNHEGWVFCILQIHPSGALGYMYRLIRVVMCDGVTIWHWIKFSPWGGVSGSCLANSVSLDFNHLILSFDLFASYLVTVATSELKEFLAQARGGGIRIMKIVIRNGKRHLKVRLNRTFYRLVENAEDSRVDSHFCLQRSWS